jgi:hypothetical protein
MNSKQVCHAPIFDLLIEWTQKKEREEGTEARKKNAP